MRKIFLILFFIFSFGFFDYMMDAIKDFGQSEKFWFWRWCKNTRYEQWSIYGSHKALPFFKTYDSGKFWLSDSWHLMKHGLLFSFAGIVSVIFPIHWYFKIFVFLFAYWLEGEIFNLFYQKLK